MLKGLMLLFLLFVFMIAFVVLAVIYKLKSAVNKFRREMDGDAPQDASSGKFDKSRYKEAKEYEEPKATSRHRQQYDFGSHSARQHTSNTHQQSRTHTDSSSGGNAQGQRQEQQDTQSTKAEEVVISIPNGRPHKKIFAEDDGEYVSFEEVK